MTASLLVELPADQPYAETLELQRRYAAERIEGRRPDTLLLVEHAPVITLGRSSKAPHLVADRATLARRGVEVHDIERGGDVTFHGPGQLVGYPVLDLAAHRKDLHWYLRQLEEVLILTAAAYGVTAGRRDGFTGVWVGDRKLASIGVHARSWVTWHGFALNVSTDLTWFDLIVPCGIAGVTMTSLTREAGREVAVSDVVPVVATAFGRVFSLQPSFEGAAAIR